MDAIHLACAEKAGAVFPTTDNEDEDYEDSFQDMSVRVDNPLNWLTT